IKQIADALYGHVCRRAFGDSFLIMGILALPGKYRGYAVAPDFFDRAKNARLVIHEDIVLSRGTTLEVIQRPLFVNVDQHMTFHRFEDAGAFDLSRLKDHVAVRQDYRLSPRAKLLKHVHRSGDKKISEGV